MGVATTMSIQDKMTARLQKIERAFNRTNKAAKELDAATQSSSLGKQYQKIDQQLKKMGSDLERLKKGQKDVGKGAENVKNQWTGAGAAIKSAIAAIGLKKSYDLTVGAALDSDSMEREFQARLGNDSLGSSLFAHLQKQAQTSAFSLEELAKNTSSFLSVTTDPKQMDGLNKIAEQLAVFDKTGQGLEGAGFSLKEALSGDIVSLAERFNMSKAQIRQFGIDKLGKAGDIEGFITQFNKLLDAQNMGTDAYQKMLESPKTQLNMFLSNLKTGFATASQSALQSLTPIIMKLNEWFSSSQAQVFFQNIGNAVAKAVELIGGFVNGIFAVATFVQEHWSTIGPIVWGIVAAVGAWVVITGIMSAAQSILNVALSHPVLMIIVILIGAIVLAIAKWVQAVGGLKVAWLIVVNALLIAWDWVKIAFFTGVYWVIDLWDRMALGMKKAGTGIANFMGDMKANVLMLLQKMVNGAIDIINGFINTLNKIPGVSIEAIENVTFGTDAQLENEAAKQARNAELAKYEAEIQQGIEDREANLKKMKDEAESARKEREAEIKQAQADAAAKKEEAANTPTAPDANEWLNSTGRSMLTPTDVDKVGSVDKINDEVNISDEDLKFLRDVAEMRFVQNFVTLTPTVSMNAEISETVDVDGVVNEIERRLEDEFVAAAEGVYA